MREQRHIILSVADNPLRGAASNDCTDYYRPAYVVIFSQLITKRRETNKEWEKKKKKPCDILNLLVFCFANQRVFVLFTDKNTKRKSCAELSHLING